MAHIRAGAVAVIGYDIANDSHAAGGIAFINDFFVVDAAAFARGLFDGALNVIVGHVIGLGLGDDIAQLAVAFRVRAALAHSDGDFTADLGKDLAARGVRLALFRLNIMPFGMTGHTNPSRNSYRSTKKL